jgi:hypothetical protein
MTPEDEYLVEKPGTKTGLLSGLLLIFFSAPASRLNAVFLVDLSSFAKSGHCFRDSGLEEVTTSNEQKTATTFITRQNILPLRQNVW